MLVGGVGESGGPSINHPTDLRRWRVKKGRRAQKAWLVCFFFFFFKRGWCFMQAIKLSSQGAMNFHVLLHLLGWRQTKQTSVSTTHFLSWCPLSSHFFNYLGCMGWEEMHLNKHMLLLFFCLSDLQARLQPVTWLMQCPRRMQVRWLGRFYLICKNVNHKCRIFLFLAL